MNITLAVRSGHSELAKVETESTDDFYYFRDGIHAALETGEFGSRFPLLMNRYEPSEWSVTEVEALQGELEAIAEGLKQLPPHPPDGYWRGKLAHSGRQCATLCDVYVDAQSRPLVPALIELCKTARSAGMPIAME